MSFEVPERHPTWEAEESLARRFGLPREDNMQDWEYEVADPARFSEFLAAYATLTSDDEKFSLMMMLIECVGRLEFENVEQSQEWRSVAALLKADWPIHCSTVQYWSCLDETHDAFLFSVSTVMRRVWHACLAENHSQ